MVRENPLTEDGVSPLFDRFSPLTILSLVISAPVIQCTSSKTGFLPDLLIAQADTVDTLERSHARASLHRRLCRSIQRRDPAADAQPPADARRRGRGAGDARVDWPGGQMERARGDRSTAGVQHAARG